MSPLLEAAVQDDDLHYYLSFKFPLEDLEKGRLLAGMLVDITELKRAEDALKNHPAAFRRPCSL